MNFVIRLSQREDRPVYLRVAPSAFGEPDAYCAGKYTENVEEAIMFERYDSAERVLQLINVPAIMIDIVSSDVVKVIEG